MLKVSTPKTFTFLSIVAPGYWYLPISNCALFPGGGGGMGGAPGGAGASGTGTPETGGWLPMGGFNRIAEITITRTPPLTSRTQNRVINTHFHALDFFVTVGC